MYRNNIKKWIDFIVALIVFILVLPIFTIVTALLVISNLGSPFFFQIRPGLNEKLFKIIKFKTMTGEKDKNGNLLPDAQRITRVGNFIRKTSIDELPQLINVLKGDMSIVGPRPLLPHYLPLYNDIQKQRHLVRPGITGWAQVNGRNAISWDTKFELDVYYVDHISFILDMKILLLSVKKVLVREGVNMDGQVTTEAFNGNN